MVAWSVVNNLYRGANLYTGDLSWAGSSTWADYTYEADVYVGLGGVSSHNAGIVFRYEDPDNFYLLAIYPDQDRVKLWSRVKNADVDTWWLLRSVDVDTWWLLRSVEYPIDPYTWCTLRIRVEGGGVDAYVDDWVLGFNGLTSHPQGKAGGRVRNARASYDDAGGEDDFDVGLYDFPAEGLGKKDLRSLIKPKQPVSKGRGGQLSDNSQAPCICPAGEDVKG